MTQFITRKTLMIITVVILLIGLALSPTIDQHTQTIIDENFKNALIVFGTAKALNATVSLIQGTQIGVGFSLSIGEVLDPLNDLIEQFSWVMLASLAALGIQKIGFTLLSTPLLSLSLGLSGLVALYVMVVNKHERYRNGILKLTVTLGVVRFVLPLMWSLQTLVYDHIVAPTYNIDTANTMLIAQEKQLANFQEPPPQEESLWNKFKQYTQTSYYQAKVDAVVQSAQEATISIINLIVAFLFNTIVFPLFFLWLIYKVLKNNLPSYV